MEVALSIIGIVLTIVSLIISTRKSPPVKKIFTSGELNVSYHPTTYNYVVESKEKENEQKPKSSFDLDDPAVMFVGAIFLAFLYYKFSTQIALVISSLGVLSILILLLYSKFDKNHDFQQKDLIPTYILYILLFVSAYFFIYPFYDYTEYGFLHGFEKAFFYVIQMLGAIIIAIGFLSAPIAIIMDLVRKQTKFRPRSFGIIIIGLLALLITSGALMKAADMLHNVQL